MSATASQSIKASETRTDRMMAKVRASPPCDAQIPRLTSVESGQGLPGQMRGRLKKLARGPLGCAQFDNYKFGHAFSTSLAMPRDELAGFRSEATEFS
ncbi:hypothetical protein M8J77_017569 [Diaphorina citri]|nr:hypothetical protein M8J77_008140 [Diaphorina citri]KAI5702196.1 hypothetical protein M8J77_017569 [Diaphorina citri]